MRRDVRRDDGTTHVLEAVIIACIMLSAVAFVATFENPATGSNASRELLSRKASDAIQLLVDTPVKDSTFGDNLFSVLLAQCLQGDCKNMTEKMEKLLPEGTSYALYVSNGQDTYPVIVTREPAGEAVTARALLEPHWSYVFTSTGLSVVNNETDPQVTYALPVYNSNVVSPGGSPIKIIVKGKKQSDGSAYTLEGFYTTLAVPPSRAMHHPAASLNFLVTKTGTNAYDNIGARVPGAYWDRYDEVMNTATGHPNNASVEFRLQLNESAGVAIPIGTELRVSIPRGWNASGWNDENWEVLAHATSRNATYNGSDVVARSLRPIISESVEFRFNATYHGDLLRYYPFRAALSRGASAEANLLVEADRWPENTQTFAIPRVVASVPRPMGSAVETTWSLAVNIPYHPAGGFQPSKSGLMNMPPPGSPSTIVSGRGSSYETADLRGPTDSVTQANSNVIITEVVILEQDGKEIFGTVTPGRIGEGHGAWTSEGDRLVWRGRHHTTTHGTLNLTFNVTGSGVPGAQLPKSELLPPVQFSAFSGRLLSQTAPGLYRDAILPNNTTASYYEAYARYLGYDPTAADVTDPLKHDFSSSPLYRATYLRGEGNYTVHPVSPFSDALYGSYVAVAKRNVPIGGEVVLTADVQSMLYALSAAGQSAGVNLTFYPPWAGDSKKPIWTQDNLDSGLLTSSVVQLVMLDLTDDGYPDAVAGTDQGRVIAFDGITGERVQGNTWIAPILDGSDGVSVIRELELITLGGKEYIVVGTDGKSGVYVVDKELNTAWSWSKTTDTATQGIAALDTRADVNGDLRNDIVLAMDNGAVYVLQALQGESTLQMLAPAISPPSPFGAFNKSQGTPAAILGLKSTGHSATPGVAVSLVSLPGAEVNYRLDVNHPEQTSASNPQLVAKSPRAGITVLDNVGATAWTFLNAPVTTIRPYDYNADGVEDLLMGSNSGNVFLVNGKRGAGPVGSAIWMPVQALVDGDARDLAHSVWLTDDGTIAFTYDGWGTHNCVSCDPVVNGLGLSYPTMNGIAMNSTMGIWAAGDNSMMLRSTEGLAPGFPWMSLVVPNATKAGVTYDFHVSLHRFNDVHFGWGPEADHGFAVGSPLLLGLCVGGTVPLALLAYCDEGLLMETTNGGSMWEIKTAADLSVNSTAGPGSKVTKNLTRVNFTTSDLGWVMGEHGTLLRSTDAGSSWQQVGLGTTVHIRDISCEARNANVCILVGDDGVALRTKNAKADWPTWANITANVSAGGRELFSAGVVSEQEMYIGGENVILHTLDGGDTWNRLPMGYVENDATRMSIFPDGSGYIWGGDATNARQWTIHDFVRSATARTTDVTAGALPSTAKAHHISAWAAITAAAGTTAQVYLSADGGNTWTPAIDTGNGHATSVEKTVPVALTTNKYSVDLAPGAPEACGICGKDIRFRVDLGTTPDISFQSVFVGDLKVEVQYRLGTNDINETFTVDLASTQMRHSTTTAEWNTDMKAIHLPLLDAKFWSRNVSGQVYDIQTGFDVGGDAHDEVWVATGGVVAENSPDYMIYAGYDPDRYMHPDDRIYVLDGKNGTILRKTDTLGGNVTAIRLADEDGDGDPDWLFATIWTPKDADGVRTSVGELRAFDPVTLEPKWSPYDPDGWRYGLQPGAIPYDLEVGHNETNVTAYLARGVYASAGSSQKLQGGGVEGFTGYKRWHMWSSRSDERGQYHIEKDIPLNWFFGPYVVEVKVDWQDSVDVVEDGNVVQKTIVQSAQFYDYFMVTPPDSVNPPSPIYTVHLMAWLDDWR